MKGNYDSFVQHKKIFEEQWERDYQKYLADKNHLQVFIDKFRCSASKASLVQSKVKTLEKLTVIEPPVKGFFNFKFDSKTPKPLLMEIKNLNLKRGSFFLKDISFKIKKDDRIIIIGDNGVGKSTLLKCLAGELKYSGDVVSFASVGYYAQQHVENLPYESSAFEYFVKKTGNESFEDFRRCISKLGLKLRNEKIKELSGGQKSRLTFALLNYFKPNLLVLDEPTNHLDIEMIEALTDAINMFEGAVISVSHDIKFIEACFKELYVAKGGGLFYIKDGLTNFRENAINLAF